MNQNQNSQIIIVNKSMSDNSVQIVIPPFRAISLYEIEDDYDNIVKEIQELNFEPKLQEHVLGFVDAFKECIDTEDVLPIAEYFMNSGASHAEPTEMIQMFQLLGEFIDEASNKNRLMH